MMNKFINLFFGLAFLFIASCTNEQKLSPVDISNVQENLNLKPIFDDYILVDSAYISNENKYLSISGEGNILVLPSNDDYQGQEVVLSKVLIKSPSEHTVNGKQYPLELQFIHSDTNGFFVYVALFVKEGAANSEFDKIISAVPKKNSSNTIYNLDFYNIFQQSPNYWTYMGTSTNKPIINDVTWFIMKEPLEASDEQIKSIINFIGENTVKQVDLNERIIYGY